ECTDRGATCWDCSGVRFPDRRDRTRDSRRADRVGLWAQIRAKPRVCVHEGECDDFRAWPRRCRKGRLRQPQLLQRRTQSWFLCRHRLPLGGMVCRDENLRAGVGRPRHRRRGEKVDPWKGPRENPEASPDLLESLSASQSNARARLKNRHKKSQGENTFGHLVIQPRGGAAKERLDRLNYQASLYIFATVLGVECTRWARLPRR